METDKFCTIKKSAAPEETVEALEEVLGLKTDEDVEAYFKEFLNKSINKEISRQERIADKKRKKEFKFEK